MKLKQVFYIAAFGLAACLVCFGPRVLAEAPVTSGWAKQASRVLSEGPESYSRYDGMRTCNGGEVRRVQNKTNGIYYWACVFGESGATQIARYVSSRGVYEYAVSLSADAGFFTLYSMCDGLEKCSYASGTDTLMTPSYLSSWQRGMDIYKDFTKNLRLYVRVSPDFIYYQFEPKQPPHNVRIAGNLAQVEAGTLSRNGRWAVVEIRSYGIVLIDTQTFRYRRVVAPGVTYGLGSDPAYELAVSEDGRYIATAGYRVGLRIVIVDENCGDDAGDTVGYSFGSRVLACEYANLDTNVLFPNFYSIHYPSFDQTGTKLGVLVQNRDGTLVRAIVAPESVKDETIPYIAFGDSFTSGEGETSDIRYIKGTNTPPHTCHVGLLSYPFLLARQWGVTGKNLACSGAETVDVFGDNEYRGQGSRLGTLDVAEIAAAQTDALYILQPGIVRQVAFAERYTPKVVTLGIGGNDAGLMDKLKTCLGVDVCDWAQDDAMKAASAREIAAVYAPVRESIARLRKASPAVKLAVIGYPEIINSDDGASCDAMLGILLSKEERQYMRESIRYLNTVLAAAAHSEGVRYVDVENSLYGHRLCEGDQGAMNGVRYGDDIAPIRAIEKFKLIGAESFHPTPYGHALVAAKILNQLPMLPSDDESISMNETQVPEPAVYWGETMASDVPAVRLVRGQANTTMRSPGGSVQASIPSGLIRPDSTVDIVLQPGNQQLGTVQSDSNGSLSSTAILPSNLEEGYSTLQLKSIDIAGHPLVVYEVLSIKSKDDATAALPQTNDSLQKVSERAENSADGVSRAVGSMRQAQINSTEGVLGVVRARRDNSPRAMKGRSELISSKEDWLGVVVVVSGLVLVLLAAFGIRKLLMRKG